MGRKLKYWLFFFILALFLFWLDQRGWLNFLHAGSDSLVVPIKKTTYQAWQKLILKKQIENDLKKKEAEISALEEMVKILKEENLSLRKQLETPLPPQWEYLDAKVIGLGQELTINKGQRASLKEGQIVLISNLLVGKIKQVSSGQSLVLLLIDSKSKIPVYTSDTKARGMLTGQYGTKVILTNVLQEDNLVIGDKVLTTGEANFPRGLLVGKVSKINKRTADIYQQAEVDLLINYQELETVFVLTKE